VGEYGDIRFEELSHTKDRCMHDVHHVKKDALLVNTEIYCYKRLQNPKILSSSLRVIQYTAGNDMAWEYVASFLDVFSAETP